MNFLVLCFSLKQFLPSLEYYRKDTRVEGMEHIIWYKDTFMDLPL